MIDTQEKVINKLDAEIAELQKQGFTVKAIYMHDYLIEALKQAHFMIDSVDVYLNDYVGTYAQIQVYRTNDIKTKYVVEKSYEIESNTNNLSID